MSKSQAAIKSLMIHVDTLHKSETWRHIKPSTSRQSEYLAQARADLVRCVGNLERAERCEDQ